MDKFLFRKAEDQKLSLSGLPASMVAMFAHSFASRRGSTLNGFGRALRTWQRVNCWNSHQLSKAACIASCSKLAISEQEVKNIVSDMSVHPRITLFQALAAIHRSITSGSSPDHLLQYATPLSVDDSGNNPSWWFALYCDEEWAWNKIAIPLNWSPPEDFSARLSAYLRKQIADSGKDVVSDISALLHQSFEFSSVEQGRLKMWILGIREIKSEEMYEYIHGLTRVARLCGSPQETVYSLMDSI